MVAWAFLGENIFIAYNDYINDCLPFRAKHVSLALVVLELQAKTFAIATNTRRQPFTYYGACDGDARTFN